MTQKAPNAQTMKQKGLTMAQLLVLIVTVLFVADCCACHLRLLSQLVHPVFVHLPRPYHREQNFYRPETMGEVFSVAVTVTSKYFCASTFVGK
eukprot:4487190-Amphidinium_carterae.1